MRARRAAGAERAWASGGGGFSNTFSRPSYQDAAVNAYLVRANLPDQQHWNASGRAYPDVSALAGSSLDGQGYCVSVDGKSFNGFTGTSASTPVWAAVIARLNGLRLAAGVKSSWVEWEWRGGEGAIYRSKRPPNLKTVS